MNLTDREENNELVKSFYPIIQNHILKENKLIIENENNKTKTLKNKTKYNFFINNLEKQKSKQNLSKSLKAYKKGNKYNNIQKLMNKKLQNFFNNNNNISNKKRKNNGNRLIIKKDKNINNNTFDNNITIKNNKNEMKDLLIKLMKLKHKINEINSMKKPKFNNKNTNKKNHDFCKSNGKLNDINNIKKINYRNNKKNSIENNKFNNELNSYKTDMNFNSSNKNNDSYKRRKITLKLPLDNILHGQNYKKIKKENSNAILNKKKYNTYNNIIIEHANYIDKIRDNEFLNIFNKFKKSMKKNKKEEIYHKKSLVFPSNFVNYLIKRKNELIIDKYRNEYLNKIDTYNYNTQKILKAIKYHNYYTFNDEKTDYKNINKSENNINKSSIKIKLAKKINDINGNKNNNVTNYNIDDKYESIFK